MAFKSKLEVQMEEQQAEKARILNSKNVPTYGLEDAIMASTPSDADHKC